MPTIEIVYVYVKSARNAFLNDHCCMFERCWSDPAGVQLYLPTRLDAAALELRRNLA